MRLIQAYCGVFVSAQKTRLGPHIPKVCSGPARRFSLLKTLPRYGLNQPQAKRGDLSIAQKTRLGPHMHEACSGPGRRFSLLKIKD